MLGDMQKDMQKLDIKAVEIKAVDIKAVEIKGLGLSVQNVRRSIAVLRAEIAGLNADSWNLQKTVTELREQINKTHDDLRFEAENLGNEPGTRLPEIAPETMPEIAPEAAPNGPLPAALDDKIPSLDDKVRAYRTTDHGAAAMIGREPYDDHAPGWRG